MGIEQFSLGISSSLRWNRRVPPLELKSSKKETLFWNSHVSEIECDMSDAERPALVSFVTEWRAFLQMSAEVDEEQS